MSKAEFAASNRTHQCFLSMHNTSAEAATLKSEKMRNFSNNRQGIGGPEASLTVEFGISDATIQFRRQAYLRGLHKKLETPRSKAAALGVPGSKSELATPKTAPPQCGIRRGIGVI
jgi:hypothetical protein